MGAEYRKNNILCQW